MAPAPYWTFQSHNNPYPWYTAQGLLISTWKYINQSQNSQATREQLRYFNFSGNMIRPILGIGQDPIADKLVALMDSRNTTNSLDAAIELWVRDFAATLFRTPEPTPDILEITVKALLGHLLGEDPVSLLGGDDDFINIASPSQRIQKFACRRLFKPSLVISTWDRDSIPATALFGRSEADMADEMEPLRMLLSIAAQQYRKNPNLEPFRVGVILRNFRRGAVRIYNAEISRRWMQTIMSSPPCYGTIPFLSGPPIMPGQFKVRMTPWFNARLHNTSQCGQVGRECLHKFAPRIDLNCDRECWVGVVAPLVALLEPFRPIIMRRWQGQCLELALSQSRFRPCNNLQEAHHSQKQERVPLKVHLDEPSPDATAMTDYLMDANQLSPTLTSGQEMQWLSTNDYQPGTIVQPASPSPHEIIGAIERHIEENLNQCQEESTGDANPHLDYFDSPGYFLCDDQDMELFPGLSYL
ncbi:hypothetical protein AOQ84DRAFT_361339 [Glonium stellatum]|uniref:Uncharacterized protein n=1 Tax=Glonium stellatum TaxID=574774 RepID=A0A8E2JVX2_9PEZI|nr:hypothetical protein AOQ84DRAFT_361339 [Glonium stellatum]